MPDFAFIARDNKGQQVTGTISAVNEREVLSTLDKRALFPVRVEAQKQAKTGGKKRIKAQLIAVTFAQLASLLRSGVPLLRSLQVIREQTSNPSLAEVLQEVHARVEDGSTLSEAMAPHERIFGDMAISMVRAGGEGGFLEDALQRVAEFTEQQEDLKGRVVGAIAYPMFLSVVGSGIVIFLIVFFVPRFAELFARLRERGELPTVTEWLLWTSDVLGSYGLFIVAGLGAGYFYLRKWLKTDAGVLWRDRWKMKIPLGGPIFQNLAVARFCRVFGVLLKNGVPILRGLDISAAAAGNRVLATAIMAASENISAGQSLAGPLAESGYFPKTVVEMIAVAEESNSLESVLTEVAESLERRTWRQLDLLVRLLEPVMLLILASVVLVVVIALLLPVLKMSTTI